MISRQQQIPTRRLTLIFRCNPSSLEDFSPLQSALIRRQNKRREFMLASTLFLAMSTKARKVRFVRCFEFYSTENNSPLATRRLDDDEQRGSGRCAKISALHPRRTFSEPFMQISILFSLFSRPRSLQWLPHEKVSNGINNNNRAERR